MNAGSKLGELGSLADLYDVRLLLITAGVGAVAVLPVVGRQFCRKGQEEGAALALAEECAAFREEQCRLEGAASPLHAAEGVRRNDACMSEGGSCSPPVK